MRSNSTIHGSEIHVHTMSVLNACLFVNIRFFSKQENTRNSDKFIDRVTNEGFIAKLRSPTHVSSFDSVLCS